jgi:hypothetical protein
MISRPQTCSRCPPLPLSLGVAAFFYGSNIVMAFAIRNLSVLAYANGFTLWHYKSGKDTLEDIAAANYMADAADMLTAGDMVMASASDGARIMCVTLADLETVVTAPLS